MLASNSEVCQAAGSSCRVMYVCRSCSLYQHGQGIKHLPHCVYLDLLFVSYLSIGHLVYYWQVTQERWFTYMNKRTSAYGLNLRDIRVSNLGLNRDTDIRKNNRRRCSSTRGDSTVRVWALRIAEKRMSQQCGSLERTTGASARSIQVDSQIPR
jgi:hypothetical protein